MKRWVVSRLLTAAILFAFCRDSRAETRTWTGLVSSDWFVGGNWSDATAPAAGDDAVIAAGTARLTNATPGLASLALTGTLVFTNWNTTLSATQVTINSGGVMTLPRAFVNTAMSNKVDIVCSNLTVMAGGRIDADGKGWAGGAVTGSGFGPGRGEGTTATGAGGGYGGYAIDGSNGGKGGFPCGSAFAPHAPGSGGGGGNLSVGGAGGGAIRIVASGSVTVNGSITANGGNGGTSSYGGGGGSGGGIDIRCRTLAGSGGGSITANGGNGWQPAYSSSGGGGRIAVDYNTGAQTVRPAIVFQALPGKMGSASAPSVATVYRGDIGTLWFPDSRFLEEPLTSNLYGQWANPDFLSWSPTRLTVSNAWLRLKAEGFELHVAEDLTVTGSAGRLEIGGGTLYTNLAAPRVSSEAAAPAVTVGGALLLTNGGQLAIYAAAAPSATPGASLRVTNAITIGTGSVLEPWSHPTNGGSVVIEAAQVRVLAGGSLNAEGKGFSGAPKGSTARAWGPGAGIGDAHSGAGGGYGGFGAGSYYYNFGGAGYGSAATPLAAGSGGGRGGSLAGGNGGGVVRLVAGTVLVNGTVTADGGANGSGGSGGSIYITCNSLAGTNGILQANGGSGVVQSWSGGGGGGRIALDYAPALQAAAGVPGIVLWAKPGQSNGSLFPSRFADIGSIWLPDSLFVKRDFTPNLSGQLVGITPWANDRLIVSNTWIRFADEGVSLNVTNDVKVLGSAGRLDLGGTTALAMNAMTVVGENSPAVMRVGGDLIVSNGASLYLFSARTNGVAPNYGARMVVAGTLRVAASSWILPVSHPVNGGSPQFAVKNLWVASGGGFNADGQGWSGSTNGLSGGFGPGGGRPGGSVTIGSGCAGGYGGRGGGSYYYTTGGPSYGSSNAPAGPGSGGVPYQSARGLSGGGLIRIEASGTIAVNGTLTANSATGSGPGSGGGIYLRCRRFTGGGQLLANGGGSGSTLAAGGGGGRIAVWRMTHSFTGSAFAANGAGSTSGAGHTWDPGGLGSVVWGPIPPSGTVMLVR